MDDLAHDLARGNRNHLQLDGAIVQQYGRARSDFVRQAFIGYGDALPVTDATVGV